MTSLTNNYVLGKGKLYFDPFDANGVTTGERYLGNTPQFEFGVESETLEHFSAESGIREKDDEILQSVTRKGTIECDNISMENMVLFAIGALASVAQNNSAVTAESLGAVQQDRFYQTASRNIAAVVVKVGATTKTITTDYTVDLVLGRIYIVSGGGIANNDVVTVDYTKTAMSREQLASASLASLQGALRFIADNPKGTNRDLYAPKVNLKPSGTLQFKGDDWMKMSFEVEFLKKDVSTAAVFIDGRAA